MMIYKMASLKFRSQMASRVKNPHTAPVAVKRCTLHASVFLTDKGSLSNKLHLRNDIRHNYISKAHLSRGGIKTLSVKSGILPCTIAFLAYNVTELTNRFDNFSRAAKSAFFIAR